MTICGTKDAVDSEALTAKVGREYMVEQVEALTDAQERHFTAKEKGFADWLQYQDTVADSDELEKLRDFVVKLLEKQPFESVQQFEKAMRGTRKEMKMSPSKPEIVRAYSRLQEQGSVEKCLSFEKYTVKKGVRSNSGVVVITVVTAPGSFSCPHDCHYCPDEPGQPRSYLSTEPGVARANQNEFCPVRQFYDRASTLAKQGHTVDKVEIIVLGGTWSGYPKEYQEQFCRDLFFAANTFADGVGVKAGKALVDLVDLRERFSILEEQRLNESAEVKIIGVTLETRPDYINKHELRRLRKFGCTRVQIGVQHTDDAILNYINRGHTVKQAVRAVRLLKESGFKVDIHLMPDLPTSTPEDDWKMFRYVLESEDLQADHWKVYPCEVVPFSKIERWYEEGTYMPYTEKDPRLLTDLLVKVKAAVHPWIRLNRVIRDIPEVSIIAGNMNTNLRQAVFAELIRLGKSCRCIRCREVREWPETPDKMRVRIRQYRSSGGTEYFISVEGGGRGLGGGATQRALAGGEKMSKKERKRREAGAGGGASAADVAAAGEDPDNAALYGLLRLRVNDDRQAAAGSFKELADTALIRELHVYGMVKAACRGVAEEVDAPQHGGIGKTLITVAETISQRQGWPRIATIAGVGVRNYYRRLGYELVEPGQYLIKVLPLLPEADRSFNVVDLEVPFITAAAPPRGQEVSRERAPRSRSALLAAAAVGGVALGILVYRRGRR